MPKSMLAVASIVACIFAATAYAQSTSTTAPTATCKAQATEKKLAGAAAASFLKKCEGDASRACDTAAVDKKLAGAAKASFTKKCISDAVGS